jgi:hypothetical protein
MARTIITATNAMLTSKLAKPLQHERTFIITELSAARPTWESKGKDRMTMMTVMMMLNAKTRVLQHARHCVMAGA